MTLSPHTRIGPYEIVDQQLAETEIRQLQSEIGQVVNSEWKAA